MKDYIISLRQKPEPVRKRIALGASVGVTALVALVWVTTMAATGVFTLATKTPPATEQAQAGSMGSNFSQLMGAVGAATGATTSPAALTIVDGGTTSTFQEPATNTSDATVIPF